MTLKKHISILVVLLHLCQAGYSQSSYFPPVGSSAWETTSPSSLGWCQERIDSLYHFLSTQNRIRTILQWTNRHE